MIWKVDGKRREMVATGPRPGSTPTKVPMRTPIKQKNKLSISKMIEKAKWRWEKSSMSKIQESPWAVEFLTTIQISHRKERRPARFLRSTIPTFGVQYFGTEKLTRERYLSKNPRFPEKRRKRTRLPKLESGSSIFPGNTRIRGHLLIYGDEPEGERQRTRLLE